MKSTIRNRKRAMRRGTYPLTSHTGQQLVGKSTLPDAASSASSSVQHPLLGLLKMQPGAYRSTAEIDATIRAERDK